MPRKLLGSPAYVAALLAVLVAVQLGAFARQIQRGFRPFSSEPARVALSWDMFANRVERCQLSWDPPLASVPGRDGAPARDLAGMSPPFEWDIVYDTAEQYREVGLWACHFKSGPTRVKLRCFMQEGREVDDELACP